MTEPTKKSTYWEDRAARLADDKAAKAAKRAESAAAVPSGKATKDPNATVIKLNP